MNFTYKLYEITLIDAYIRLHFRSLVAQAELRRRQKFEQLLMQHEGGTNVLSADAQLQLLIDQLTHKKKANRNSFYLNKAVHDVEEKAHKHEDDKYDWG